MEGDSASSPQGERRGQTRPVDVASFGQGRCLGWAAFGWAASGWAASGRGVRLISSPLVDPTPRRGDRRSASPAPQLGPPPGLTAPGRAGPRGPPPPAPQQQQAADEQHHAGGQQPAAPGRSRHGRAIGGPGLRRSLHQGHAGQAVVRQGVPGGLHHLGDLLLGPVPQALAGQGPPQIGGAPLDLARCGPLLGGEPHHVDDHLHDVAVDRGIVEGADPLGHVALVAPAGQLGLPVAGSGEHLEQHDAQRIDVPLGGVDAVDPLLRHVAQRSKGHLAGLSLAALEVPLGDTEVEHLDVAGGGDPDVARLDVPVQQLQRPPIGALGVVRDVQRPRHLGHDLQRSPDGHRPVVFLDLQQIDAVDELHHHGPPIGGSEEVPRIGGFELKGEGDQAVHRHHRPVADHAEDPRLVPQAGGHVLGVVEALVVEDLQRDFLLEGTGAVQACMVHRSHAPLADGRQHLVAAAAGDHAEQPPPLGAAQG